MSKQSIDIATVNELVEIMGEDMSMLIDSYIADTRTKLAQLAELDEIVDYETIFRLAHSLKGSSRNIGVTAFADYCEKIEERARARKLKVNDINLNELNRLFDNATKEISQRLSGLSKL